MKKEETPPAKIWYKPSESLPPQGLKVLYFKEGDIWVVYRFGKHWVPIPFCDSKFANSDEPEMWAYIDFPKGFRGQMFTEMSGKRISVDEMQVRYPEEYDEMVQTILKSIGNSEFWRDYHGK